MTLDPTAQQLLDMIRASGAPPVEQTELSVARVAAVRGMLALALDPPPGVSAADELINVPGGEIKVRVYRPAEAVADEALPVVIFFHGGGWVVCDLESHDHLCRHISSGGGCAVVAVDYRLAPEYIYPVAVDDAAAAARWVVSNAQRHGFDADRIALFGDSAGGNLAAVLALQSGADGLPRFALQVLAYPVLDVSKKADSYARLGKDYRVTEASMEFFIKQYVPDVARRREWRASPLLAENLADAPPALIYTAEYDVLVDEGRAYAERLEEAGVTVTYRDLSGHMHGFLTAGKILPVAAVVLQEISHALRQAFDGHNEAIAAVPLPPGL